MSSYAIRAEGLSKRYRIEATGKRRRRSKRLAESASAVWHELATGWTSRRSEPRSSILWALRDLSFEVRHGDPIGIIGANGAGKTTLLKILARITSPTEGRARMRGRVGSLLEVGTGFHSELTGRENVYLNGAVLGMRRREIARKFDAIVDFSGVEDFIETPLKFYSSGMRMRLAFSVAAHLEPEILLVDEVLAVGDIAFQNKCLNKMQEVTSEGRTVLFVSHNLGAVRSLCPTSMVLEHGRLKFMGDTIAALDQYLASQEMAGAEQDPDRHSTGSSILGVSTCDEKGKPARSFAHTAPIRCRILVSLLKADFRAHLTLKVYGGNMETVLATHDFEPAGESLVPKQPGTYTFEVKLPAGLLAPGKYYLGAELTRQKRHRGNRPVSKMDHVAEFDVFDGGSVLARLNVPWQGLVHSQAIRWTRLDAGEPSGSTVKEEA